MAPPFRYRLSDREKDALLAEQAALIEHLAVRVAELEALLAKPRKTSQNSHVPPSQDRCAQRMRSIKPSGGGDEKHGKRRKPRPSRPGSARPLTDAPDETIKRRAIACPHCAADVSGQTQTCRHRYDHIDIPPIAPVVTRIELFGGRCGACGCRFRAAPPEGMAPGSPFGARVRALLLYLHHSHHVGFERLSRMMAELFGLTISEGAITNAFRRAQTAMTAACAAIKEKLLAAPG
jgi:transposase